MWPQVTLAAIYGKLLDELFFSSIKLTLINGDGLFIQLAPSNSSTYDLGCSGFLYWLLFLVLIILYWWTIDWWIQIQLLLLFLRVRAVWCC